MAYNSSGTKSGMARRSTCVYRLYDVDGELLYVGLTVNPLGRFAKHASHPWWPEVADHDLEWFDTRADAQAAETRAIHDEGPRYNISRPRMECC